MYDWLQTFSPTDLRLCALTTIPFTMYAQASLVAIYKLHFSINLVTANG
jgi:hypothetical protein